MTATTTAGIIATYNQRQYIVEAVNGLVDQVDELIVIDDASSDDTTAVLRTLDHHANLRVIRNETQLGVSRSYNRAVDATDADVLLIQGGDDRSLPGRAARSVAALSDPAVSLAYSVPTVIDAEGTALPAALASEFLAGQADIDPLVVLFFQGNFVCAPAAAMRRADYVGSGGFRAGLDLLQDYDLWLALAAEGRFAVLDEPVVEYRKHGTNLSREYVGIDSPKQRRFAAEQESIRNGFLSRASSATLERIAGHLGLDLGRFSRLSAEERIVQIQLSHHDRLVLRRGVAYLYDAAREPDGEERLARLGLSLADLTRFAVLADHDNLAGVTQAFGSAEALMRRAGFEKKD